MGCRRCPPYRPRGGARFVRRAFGGPGEELLRLPRENRHESLDQCRAAVDTPGALQRTHSRYKIRRVAPLAKVVWWAQMTSTGSAPPAAPDRPKRKHVRGP